MKYKSTNELEHFSFESAVIASLNFQHGTTFTVDMDNLTILENNRHNRDIRQMRANGVVLTFSEVTSLKAVAEGYKLYDANNVLKETVDDKVIEPTDYKDFFESLAETTIYSIEETTPGHCIINIDGEYETYIIELNYSQSTVEWDRFLSKE